jgi:hypothetical protein
MTIGDRGIGQKENSVDKIGVSRVGKSFGWGQVRCHDLLGWLTLPGLDSCIFGTGGLEAHDRNFI